MFSQYNFLIVDEWWTYWHASTPIFPFVAAVISLVVGNITSSMILASMLLSLLGIAFAKKIAVEFMHLKKDATYQLISVLASVLPVVSTYYTLKFFTNGATWKHGVLLSFSMTLILFAREQAWPMLVVPMVMFLALKSQRFRGNLQGLGLPFKTTFLKNLVSCRTFKVALIMPGIFHLSRGAIDSSRHAPVLSHQSRT